MKREEEEENSERDWKSEKWEWRREWKLRKKGNGKRFAYSQMGTGKSHKIHYSVNCIFIVVILDPRLLLFFGSMDQKVLGIQVPREIPSENEIATIVPAICLETSEYRHHNFT